MKILAVEHAVPSRQVGNADWLAALRTRNRDLDAAAWDSIARRVQAFLDEAGTQVRFCLAEDEKAIDLLLSAGRRALDRAGTPPESIDLVIYAGVARGWLEPAMATLVQHELRLVNATGFDTLDACASWLRALDIIHGLMARGAYRRAMIVNCEASLINYCSPEIGLSSTLDSQLAVLTIGEAATATIISNENPSDDFYFTFKTYGEHFGLCMIPFGNMREFLNGTPVAENGTPMAFFSQSKDLVRTTVKRIIEAYEADPALRGREYDICFGHAASEKASEVIRRRLRIPREAYFSTHARFGNTVAASIPLGLSLALHEQRLARGDRTLIVVGSAGISIGFCTFTF